MGFFFDTTDKTCYVFSMQDMQLTDAELVHAYLAGDKAAFDVLTLRYLKPVHSLAFHYAKNRADAEDITQDAFIKALRHIKRFDTDKSFKPWILQIARNQALDWLKKKKPFAFSDLEREDGESMIDSIPDMGLLPNELALQAETVAGVRKTLETLSAADRRLLFFRYFKELSFKDIADEAHELVDTVKSRHRRLLLKLRRTLGTSAQQG